MRPFRLHQVQRLVVVSGQCRCVAGFRNDVAHASQGLGIVFHHQDARPIIHAGPRTVECPGEIVSISGDRPVGHRDREGESRSPVGIIAFRPNPAAVGLDYSLADGHTQTRSCNLSPARVSDGPGVLPERVCQLARQNASTFVRDRDRNVQTFPHGLNHDDGGSLRVSGCVGKEIDYDLDNAGPVCHHEREFFR